MYMYLHITVHIDRYSFHYFLHIERLYLFLSYPPLSDSHVFPPLILLLVHMDRVMSPLEEKKLQTRYNIT